MKKYPTLILVWQSFCHCTDQEGVYAPPFTLPHISPEPKPPATKIHHCSKSPAKILLRLQFGFSCTFYWIVKCESVLLWYAKNIRDRSYIKESNWYVNQNNDNKEIGVLCNFNGSSVRSDCLSATFSLINKWAQHLQMKDR